MAAEDYLNEQQRSLSIISKANSQPQCFCRMEIEDLLENYKTIKSFASDCGILITPEKYRDQLQCINACSPTLNDLQTAYGSKMKVVWMQKQINDIQTLVGVNEKLLAHQVVMLIEIFMTNGNVKASMLMNFFHRMIAGHYGRFYGTIDIMQIGEAWQKFIAECNELYKEQNRRIKEAERARRDAEKEKQMLEDQKNAMYWEDFRQIQKKQYGVDLPNLHKMATSILKRV